jgi:hypothetical protein
MQVFFFFFVVANAITSLLLCAERLKFFMARTLFFSLRNEKVLFFVAPVIAYFLCIFRLIKDGGTDGSLKIILL